jgi:hypothetical protein
LPTKRFANGRGYGSRFTMLRALNRNSTADLEHWLRTTASTGVSHPKDGALICAHCGHLITTPERRFAVQGAHEHRFVNPAYVVFHIGCFSQAPGCASVGSPTSAFSWFAGYSWSVAVCAACGIHLGWRYSGPDTFYGLILSRLRAQPGA